MGNPGSLEDEGQRGGQVMTEKKDLEIRIYGLDELAEALGITRRTLYNYLKNGRLKGVKIGGEWRITEENLVRFLNRV